MFFELPPLPYKPDALEPRMSRKTLDIHHGKHHEAYVNNLNILISGTKFEDADLEMIIKVAEGPIFNNASQVWNHTFFFESLKPADETTLKGSFAKVITGHFGSVQYFKETFNKAALSLFGSGWVWLLWNPKGTLEIIQESNAGNPLRKGLIPLLACDCWEHSYYLDYQNRRTDYLNAFWNLINWDIVEKRYIEARKFNTIRMSPVSH
ncbi:MAG TPA: superoxide dismutase [Bacteroidales bacterium]|nr:superoxide dismutase [Bacteroidales bacterium]